MMNLVGSGSKQTYLTEIRSGTFPGRTEVSHDNINAPVEIRTDRLQNTSQVYLTTIRISHPKAGEEETDSVL
jgi:hypothetical protein